MDNLENLTGTDATGSMGNECMRLEHVTSAAHPMYTQTMALYKRASRPMSSAKHRRRSVF